MSETLFHTVIIDEAFVKANSAWLHKFVFDHQGLHFFSCYSYSDSSKIMQMVEFEVLLKANGGKHRVLLPLHAVVAIFPDKNPQNPLGFFLDQKECHE